MDARRSATRASKALAFFRQDSCRSYHLYPHPWGLKSAPYYVVQGLDNRDGHGGYGSTYRFDCEGVPYICTRRGREFYDPLVIARYVLRMFSLSAITGDEGGYAAAESAATALTRSGIATGVWRPGHPVHDMSGDVPSCIIQGSAISALVRVGQRNPAVVPSDLLERAVKALVSLTTAGGTVTHGPEGPFLEESNNSLSHVLNGCVYGLWALYDLMDGMSFSELRPLVSQLNHV